MYTLNQRELWNIFYQRKKFLGNKCCRFCSVCPWKRRTSNSKHLVFFLDETCLLKDLIYFYILSPFSSLNVFQVEENLNKMSRIFTKTIFIKEENYLFREENIH